MTIHLPRFKDMDETQPKLAPCKFWFEECELLNGGIRLDGCADIQIDSTGNWYFESFEIGSWIPAMPFRNPANRFLGETIMFVEGRSRDMFDLIRAELVRKYDDAITDACIAAGEA